MRHLINIFLIVTMIFAVIFAVSNRFVVPLSFWPFPFSVDTPLFLISFLFFLVGFIFGWLNYWMHARPRLHAKIKHLSERLHYIKEHSVLSDNATDNDNDK